MQKQLASARPSAVLIGAGLGVSRYHQINHRQLQLPHGGDRSDLSVSVHHSNDMQVGDGLVVGDRDDFFAIIGRS